MSDNVPEVDSNEVSQEEISLAEAQEQAQLNAVQNTHLKRRVVVLRLQNNRLQAEVERLRDQSPKDEVDEPDSKEVQVPSIDTY